MPIETGVSGAGGNGTVEVTGPSGDDLAREETADRAADAAETLAGAVDGTAVRVTTVEPTFITAPPADTGAPAVRIVGDGLDRFGNPILQVEVVPDEALTVVQGDGLDPGDPDTAPWVVGTRWEGDTVPIAREETAQSIRDRLPEGLATSGGLKVEIVAPLPAGAEAIGTVEVTESALPSGASTEATLATRASEATTQAIEAAVDGLEGGQATGNASLSNIDTNTDQIEAKLDTLETNKATASNQTTGNATLDAILTALDEALGPYARTTFGQIRVAMRETQFDNTQEYGLDTRAWGTQTANGGTVAFNSTTGMTDLTVTSASGSTAKLRTNTHFIYQPGAVTRIILTAVHSSSGVSNQTRRWGFFNDSDGIFFELVGTSLSLVRRTSTSGSPVNSPLPLASWDVPANAPTLTNGNRFEIDLQWLSFGTVRIWANGRPLHEFDFSNSIALPYTRTAQLPISLEVENTGASTAATLSYVCSTVYLDGGTPLKFVPKERALTAPKTGIGTTYAPLIGLRMASTVSGRTNRKIVIPTTSRVANASGRATVAVIMNPASTTGGTWTAADAASGVEYNEGITSYTGGTELTRIFLPNTADSRELDGESSFALNGLHLRRDAFNTTGDMVLFVGKADVGTSDIDIVARWKELG